MRGLAFRVTCPRCGSERSRLVNQTEAGGPDSTTQLIGIVECCECARQYVIDVFLRLHQSVTREQRNAKERQRTRHERVAS